MKKSQLIGLLNQIRGNPDIVLWNGMVGDYMHISNQLLKSTLVAQSFDDWLFRVQHEERRNRNDFDYSIPEEEIIELKKKFKLNWEHNQFVTKEDIQKGYYRSKQVVYIQAKPKGITTWDRLGSISY